jgi:hypothetical protein
MEMIVTGLVVRKAYCIIMYVERVLKCGHRPMNTVHKNIAGSNFTKFNPLPKRLDPLRGLPSLQLSSFPAIKEAETGSPPFTSF